MPTNHHQHSGLNKWGWVVPYNFGHVCAIVGILPTSGFFQNTHSPPPVSGSIWKKKTPKAPSSKSLVTMIARRPGIPQEPRGTKTTRENQKSSNTYRSTVNSSFLLQLQWISSDFSKSEFVCSFVMSILFLNRSTGPFL